MEMRRFESVPENIKFSEEEIETLKNKYTKVISENISTGKFGKQKNQKITINQKPVFVNTYTLTITKEQLNNLYIKMLETIKDDEIIIKRIETLQEYINMLNSYLSEPINLKDTFIAKIENTIEDINKNNIGNEETKIIIYENAKQTVRTSIQTTDYQIDIDVFDNEGKYIEFSKKEKEELFVKIKEGDNEARTTFINGNLRLVLSVIQRFCGRGESADDLFQVGCVGLIKAIDNFDLSQNVQFSTYAVPMIIGEVKRYLRDNNSIRVSRSIRDLAYKAIQFKERYNKEHGKEPTIDEIAKELGVEREEVVFSFDAIQDPVSLQEPIYNDGAENIYIIDQIKDSKNTDEQWAESMTISGALQKLNEKERTIVTKRFFDGRTQMEVADEIGISQAQVSRLEKSAIEHIKRFYK